MNYRCFFPSPPSLPWNTLSHLHSLLISMGTNYGNFPFVRTGQPDQSCHYESFTFNQICPAKLVICWIICMGLMVFFSKNSLRWPISFLKWPVWPASSDWRPKGPCAVLSSNEQCKLWAHKTSLSRQLVSWVWHWRLQHNSTGQGILSFLPLPARNPTLWHYCWTVVADWIPLGADFSRWISVPSIPTAVEV